ncbi:hypothetical protein B0H11DRAFT_2293816 [Mycena galericulata]|nr:hypothetical protein B0H11DRAFT_2293816 [Mycena galericulata]
MKQPSQGDIISRCRLDPQGFESTIIDLLQSHPSAFRILSRLYGAENIVALIEKEVGPSDLLFRAALRELLPPPKTEKLSQKPAFQCLLHIGTISEFMHAVVDIAKGITRFSDPSLCFPALTPDRMLFQTQHLTTAGPVGFILDLDYPDEPSSRTEYTREQYLNPRALRFAAYDLVATTTPRHYPTLYPRHALESLFNSLFWFCVANEFRHSLGPERMVSLPRHANMFSNVADQNLPPDRTDYVFREFVKQRRAFFHDWVGAFPGISKRSDDMMAAVDAWLEPLWKLIGEAHLFSRDRKGEPGYDWETLGGMFTVEKVMKIFETGPVSWRF